MAATKKRAGGDGATSPAPRTRRKRSQVEAGSRGLGPAELGTAPPPEEVRTLATTVAEDGGQVLCTYREPLGGAWVLLVALPIERLEPTPFQRDLSQAHVERLRQVMERIDRFLDPVIAVREEGHYWTPNGRHRLEALRRLGARSIVALLVVDPAIAYRILALNTEKAHNLRERALEVVRMAADLARRQPGRRESEFALEFEEAALVTLGLCYEERPRFAAGAYHPLVRRIDTFLDEPLPTALERRRERARALLVLDDLIESHVAALKARGLESPYLRNLVVARINPLRFQRGGTVPGFEEVLGRVLERARSFDPSRVGPGDLASLAGAGAPAEEG
ncbi:MAG TPA: ParB N-terminal domain-containing protein [Polyangia bacterium]|nr:ParB N-terminal domain-containing protein [Polyangia bacterium]